MNKKFLKKNGTHLYLICQKQPVPNGYFYFFIFEENNYSTSSSSSPHSFPPTSLPISHPFPSSSSAFQFSSDYASTAYCINSNNNNNNNNSIMNHHHHPTLSLHPINQSIIASTLSTVSASSKAYKKRKKMLQNYICTDCGAQRSTEWRRGPFGPKTLCNACGLRWAKKNKKKNLNNN
ncbi:hypothetical protein BJ944DRAFT_231271 [Cunninghamella echinulata]|nr:hypothetical protein BJ944DRAFT_231271 [Cunninghamella echinulata]